MAGLKHITGTFYNHNHLFYWSGMPDKEAYAIETVEKKKPAFLIQAGIIEGHFFPEEYFKERYSPIVDLDDMHVFRSKKSNLGEV